MPEGHRPLGGRRPRGGSRPRPARGLLSDADPAGAQRQPGGVVKRRGRRVLDRRGKDGPRGQRTPARAGLPVGDLPLLQRRELPGQQPGGDPDERYAKPDDAEDERGDHHGEARTAATWPPWAPGPARPRRLAPVWRLASVRRMGASPRLPPVRTAAILGCHIGNGRACADLAVHGANGLVVGEPFSVISGSPVPPASTGIASAYRWSRHPLSGQAAPHGTWPFPPPGPRRRR